MLWISRQDLSDRLKMRKHLEFRRIPAMLDEFVPHETAGSNKAVDAFPIGAEKPVDIGFENQHELRCSPGVTLFFENVPERPILAGLAGFAAGDKVVARTERLEVVQVIDDGNVLSFQLPED